MQQVMALFLGHLLAHCRNDGVVFGTLKSRLAVDSVKTVGKGFLFSLESDENLPLFQNIERSLKFQMPVQI